jgi:hypothetical protein
MGITAHVIVVEDADATLEGLTFRGGSTTDPVRVAKTYAGDRFRSLYEAIDGAGLLFLGKSNVVIRGCTITDNHAGMCGGGISNQGVGLVKVVSCAFERNTAYHTGGAADNLTPGSVIEIRDSTFKDNVSNAGSICGGPHGQVTVFKNTRASIHDCDFVGEVYAVDAAAGSTIDSSGNVYEGRPTEPREPGLGGGTNDKLKHTKYQSAFELELGRFELFPRVRR